MVTLQGRSSTISDMRSGTTCVICREQDATTTVSLVKTLRVCSPCSEEMFSEDEGSDWDSMEAWAVSHDECPRKEQEALRKFSRRLSTKIALGKSLIKSDVRPRLPLWVRS